MAYRFVSKRGLVIALLAFVCLLVAWPAFAKVDMMSVCDTYAKNVEDYSGGCWSCDIFMIFFDAANEVAGHVANVVEGPAKTALAVFLGVWLVFNTAVFFSSVNDAPGLGEFATKVGGTMFRGTFAVIFLAAGSSFVFEYFVNPVLTDAAAMSVSMLSSSPCTFDAGGGGSSALPMSPGVRSSLKCMIEAIASGLAPSQAIAQGMRCGAFFYWDGLPILPNPIMWAWGCALGTLFYIIAFLFPITMLDVIFRIGLMVGMIPLFIVAWVFPATRRFAKTGWDVFFQSAIIFVVTAIIVSMIVSMVEHAWVATADADVDTFRAMMQGNKYPEAFKLLTDKSAVASLFIVLAVAVWGLIMAPKTDKLASEFTGGDFPESCGIKALKAMIDFAMNIIFLILTILTLGAGAVTFISKAMMKVAQTAEQIEKLRQRIEKMKEMQKKIKKVQDKAKKVRAGVQFAQKKVGSDRVE